MNIALIYTKAPKKADKSFQEVGEQVRDIRNALTVLGHHVEKREIETDLFEALVDLTTSNIDLVWNSCEHVNGVPTLEATVAAVLEELGLKYTGSSFRTISECLDKARTKRILVEHGLPTAKYFVVVSGETDAQLGQDLVRKNDMKYPVMIKPARQDASVGVKKCDSWDELLLNIGRSEKHDVKIVVEEFIEGREFCSQFYGTDEGVTPIPVGEVMFSKGPGFMTATSKYGKDENENHVEILKDEKLAHKLMDVSMRSYKLMNIRDYGRVDLRTDKKGNPYILEVNPNCDIMAHPDIRVMIEATGNNYIWYINQVLQSAKARYGL